MNALFDWSERYPQIVHAARMLRVTRFLIDGEAVVCGENGVSDFDKLHSRQHDGSVVFYGFDLLSLDGADIRGERLDDRRAKLRTLVARPDRIRSRTTTPAMATRYFGMRASSDSRASSASAAMRHIARDRARAD